MPTLTRAMQAPSTHSIATHLPNVLLMAGILFAILLLLRGIAAPWNGYGDSDGALFASMARNYLQFGILELKFGQLVTYEAISAPVGVHYLHHPPLFPLLSALSITLFGESEFSVRLVSVAATLLTALILYHLTARALGRQGGLLCAFFFLAYPSTIIFGRKPGYEALTLCLIVLGLWLYVRYSEKPGGLRLAALLGALAAGALSDWAAYLLPAALLLLQLTRHRSARTDWALLSGLMLVPSMVLGAFLYSIYLVDPASVLDLLHQGLAYAGLFSPDGAVVANIKEARIEFTLQEYVFRLVKNLDSGFGLMALLLASVGIVLARPLHQARDYGLVLAITSVITMVVFWRSLYFHLWWLQLLAAPLALMSAVAVQALMQSTAPHFRSNPGRGPLLLLLAVLIPVGIGMIYNVRALASEQIRVLPESLHEGPDFIRQLGRQLQGLTSQGDEILTNLGPVASSIANPYARILPYYARRRIEADVTRPEELDRRLAAGKGTHFLLGPMDHPGTDMGTLKAALDRRAEPHTLVVAGHRLALYRLTPPADNPTNAHEASR